MSELDPTVLQTGETPATATDPAPAAQAPADETVLDGNNVSWSANAPAVQPTADESDGAFVLRTFGVNPAKYVKQGVLDRSLLDHDVDSYRTLFANRILHGRFA